MKETFKPLLDRVVVRRAKKAVPGDLVLPDKYQDGTV